MTDPAAPAEQAAAGSPAPGTKAAALAAVAPADQFTRRRAFTALMRAIASEQKGGTR